MNELWTIIREVSLFAAQIVSMNDSTTCISRRQMFLNFILKKAGKCIFFLINMNISSNDKRFEFTKIGIKFKIYKRKNKSHSSNNVWIWINHNN